MRSATYSRNAHDSGTGPARAQAGSEVDLGLVYGVTVGQDRIATIDMTLTSAACPLTDVIEDQTRDALEGLVSDFRINWVWLPPWGPDKITEDGREQLRALGFNV
jgi:metal-sulfur cluster biosynthetic enzyme